MASTWCVHKFGGTSVLNAERYKNVFRIITENLDFGDKAIVVSAMKGVTDDLITLVNLARQQKDYGDLLRRIEQRHIDAADQLLTGERLTLLKSVFVRDCKEIQEILRGVWLVRDASEQVVQLVSGMGEVWSAQMLNAYMAEKNIQAQWLDSRKVLVVRNSEGRVTVDWELSKKNIKKWREENSQKMVVITGFVAANENGAATTLGRNGSDYSGSIFGVLFDAREIYIWTDVDGVMSADPRLVPDAVVLDEMSYNEVSELAYFGAKVVHPATMTPAIDRKIPIWIKNTFNPNFPGTKIHDRAKSDRSVKGFSAIDRMALLNVEGAGMVGVPGIAERLFGALRSSGVNVVLISQASSEHSICFAVSESQSGIAREAIHRTFAYEMQAGLIDSVALTSGVSILAAVGDNMAHMPGVAGKFFTSLGRAGVNIRAIAQGSSERNISVVIDSCDSVRAIRTVHSAFIQPHFSISLGLIGIGLIGGTFLRQLTKQSETLRKERRIDVKVRGLANSQKMYLVSDSESLECQELMERLQSAGEPLDLVKFAQHVNHQNSPHSVIIDATASSELTPFYPKWLETGVNLISPNKKANTESMESYARIRRAAANGGRHFLYSTNVGAGLPIVQTLRDLRSTGDKFHLIQGILSGTLSFLFSEFDGTRPFSEIVRDAMKLGFTEPDPREDLSGQDVVRKLVILAREAGVSIEREQVEVEGLVPSDLQDPQKVSKEEFVARLSELDTKMTARIMAAKNNGEILRYVGSLDEKGHARVGLESLPIDHAFASVKGTDNIVLFKTDRYQKQPLVIKGPGAGPEVTAAGVFADLLRLCQYLGAV
jgi:bifunctional aspartokinase / homoserine dehydrogenase 1